MKNKRKIWVRIGAFMAALICCVLCVVPAYAEGTEAAEEDLSATIAEQEELINAYLRLTNLAVTAANYLESVGKTYNDVNFYGIIDSDYPTYTDAEFQRKTGSFYYGFYVRVYYLSEQLGFSLMDEYACNIVSISTFSGGGYEYKFVEPNTGGAGWSVICGTNGEWTGMRRYRPTALEIDTTHFVFEIIGTYPTYNPYLPYVCSRSLSCDPSFLLALDRPNNDNDIYNQGYAAGYQFGFEEGEMFGLEEGLDRGREEGYTEGDADGYRRGYDDGMHQTSLIEGIKSLFRAPMEFIESVLDFVIFGIDLGDAVKALVSMMLLALVITVVWKAVK